MTNVLRPTVLKIGPGRRGDLVGRLASCTKSALLHVAHLAVALLWCCRGGPITGSFAACSTSSPPAVC